MLWAQSFIATLIIQFLQLLYLAIGAGLIASFGHDRIAPLTIVMGIAILLIAGRVPDMLISNVIHAHVMTGGSQDVMQTAQAGVETAVMMAA